MNIIALQLFNFTLFVNKSTEFIFAVVFGYFIDWFLYGVFRCRNNRILHNFNVSPLI